jgi:hypothetical protein
MQIGIPLDLRFRLCDLRALFLDFALTENTELHRTIQLRIEIHFDLRFRLSDLRDL